MIERLRAETPGCAHRNHLNNAGSSLPPLPVIQAVQQHLDLEATIGGYEAADEKQADINGFYEVLGRMLNAKAGNFAFSFNATDAYNRALSAIPWRPGDVILTTTNDYVSNQIAFLSLQKRFGIRVVRARDTQAGDLDLEDFEKKVRNLHPRLAAVTHVPTNSGLVQDVAAAGRICREHEIWYLVDACQSAGQMALDVQEIGCDFLTATMRKFLRGPRGAGFLYASDRVLDAGLELLTPDMRGADWTGPDTYQTLHSAQRFEYWEMPPALMLGGKAAVEYALTLGFDWIEPQVARNAALTRALLSELPGVRVLDRGSRLSGIVTAHSDRWEPRSLTNRLLQHGINCRISTRMVAQIDFQDKGVDWALRISPHYYNTEEEIRQAVQVLAGI